MSQEQSNVALLEERLRDPSSPAVVIDGGVGTSARDILEQVHGLKLEPGVWSATAQLSGFGEAILHKVHSDFFAAGAAVAVANTFRTQVGTFLDAGYLREEAEEATDLAIRTAIKARNESGNPCGVVAASIAPIEDCYNPAEDLGEDKLYGLQYEQIAKVLGAGAEMLFIETMPSVAEARAALRAANAHDASAIVSFYYRDSRPHETGLWLPNSGHESLSEAAKIAQDLGAITVGANCIRPSKGLSAVVSLVETDGLSLPVGTWVQGYEPRSPEVDDVSVDRYKDHVVSQVRQCIQLGARLVGGCCNVNADDIARIVAVADEEAVTTQANEL